MSSGACRAPARRSAAAWAVCSGASEGRTEGVIRRDAPARSVIAAHRAAWTTEKKTDLKVLAAAQRQIRDQAREPEERFGDVRQALEELRDKVAVQARVTFSDASRARALQRLAAERAGLPTITPAAPRQVGRTA
ncbi:hypothetical protein ACFCZT_14160 [Streptomyces sp. NPDC056230]|uniref:hypothetical protein n=1 Tax=unclassified Streptomyces TaxID=2593676 RepID=UPI0035E2AEAB